MKGVSEKKPWMRVEIKVEKSMIAAARARKSKSKMDTESHGQERRPGDASRERQRTQMTLGGEADGGRRE